MKILFLNTDIGYGGAEKMLVWVANQCVIAGHNVTFLTYRENCIKQTLHPLLKHVHVDTNDNMGGKGLWRTSIYLHNYIKREKFNLGIAFLSPSQLRLSIAAVGTDIKLLYSQRGDPYQCKGGLIHLINRLAFNCADAFVFQTSMAQAYYSIKIQKRSVVISNPISPLVRTRKRSEGVDKRIVCVARLHIQQKRQDILINAFKQLTEQFPEYTLEFYGDGPDEQRLKNLAADCPKIYFMGQTSNVAEVIQNAAMTVLPSDYEGIPNSLLESMSIGVPCIATDCSPGGAAMLIQSYEYGILIPKGNTNALVEAIKYFIINVDEAEHMGEKAVEVNRIFAPHIIAKKWIEYIENEI